MAVALPRIPSLTSPASNGSISSIFKGGVQSCRLLFWSLLFQSTARSPRNHLCQDGRFFLQGSPRQYDIITGEPPPPKVAGFGQSLYRRVLFHHEQPVKGGRNRYFLASS